MKDSRFWWPFGVSLAATPVCLLLGLGSAGVGHGDYVLARILFPYAMLAMLLDGTASILILLSVVQYPVYGLILGRAAMRGRLGRALALLAAVHAVSAQVCFLLPGENFR